MSVMCHDNSWFYHEKSPGILQSHQMSPYFMKKFHDNCQMILYRVLHFIIILYHDWLSMAMNRFGWVCMKYIDLFIFTIYLYWISFIYIFRWQCLWHHVLWFPGHRMLYYHFTTYLVTSIIFPQWHMQVKGIFIQNFLTHPTSPLYRAFGDSRYMSLAWSKPCLTVHSLQGRPIPCHVKYKPLHAVTLINSMVGAYQVCYCGQKVYWPCMSGEWAP